MKKIIISLFVAIISLSCNSTDPEIKVPEREKSFIEAADVSCDEIWLKLKVGDIDLPAEGVIRIDGIKDKPVSVTTKDTILYIDSLEVNRNYKFQVILLNQGQTLISNEITVKTLDTTSHNFTWQTFEFGEHSHSLLYDVAIIDENNIWAVGEIYVNDSLGNPNPKCYNAVHWDGTKWELKRISVLFRENNITPPLDGTFVFSEKDIWFVGSLPIHGDGNNWIMHDLRTTLSPDLSLSKAWGLSSNNIYFVGNSGSIAHWNGSIWAKIESGTTVNLKSIISSPDGKTMWACGSNDDYFLAVFLEKTGNDWEKVFEGNPAERINDCEVGVIQSVWTNSNQFVYLGSSSGLYRHTKKEALKLQKVFSPSDAPYSYKGEEKNNIWVCGQNGLVGHYNGKNYYEISGLKKARNTYYGIDIKGKTTCVVGKIYNNAINSKAIIQIIKQQ
ncbi:MAG: hypothetical protein GX452_04755 [Ignavibacteriales bacterium]|jgi:hypothetical protein|nr:hypothetical protein [Ignavibacteriaceae bacterium]NLH60694.1 hypothetical protein [Ignavibacteriales bacterium]HOJ19278.1 hypothetical protein [Ignavibacteriaceae bacterium]